MSEDRDEAATTTDTVPEGAREHSSPRGSHLQGLGRVLSTAARASWNGLSAAALFLAAGLRFSWRHERTQRARSWLLASLRRAWAFLATQGPRVRRGGLGLLRYGLVAGALALVVLVGGRFGLHAVEPGQVGVRYSKWGDGVTSGDFGPGLHLSVPGVHKWHLLSRGTELMSWRAQQPLDVRTADGSTVALELSVPYRIQEGAAHRIVARGARAPDPPQGRAHGEPILLDAFGQLVSEDFADTEKRSAVLASAKEQLDAALAEVHLEADRVLVESIAFSESYEEKLVQTQRSLQRGRVLEADEAKAKEEAVIQRRRNEMDRQLQARRIELDLEIEQLEVASKLMAVETYREVEKYESDLAADADREYERLVAQGKTLVLTAEKLERRLRGEILSGEGGEDYLALQAARATRLEEVVLNANDPRVPNPLEVGDMLELFRGE